MRADELANLVEASVRAALAPLAARLLVVEGKATGLEHRIDGLASQRPIPGPQGQPGPPGDKGTDGKDGRDGANGKDGATLAYKGTFQRGASYAAGDLVTHSGSLWHANEDIGLAVPGDGSGGWTLMVKRGADGKDARREPT